ncbi:MAG: response regulator [Flavobacteriaceae bacterium]|nr:response regulator [Flavobacteriaceae bacterium]|tara:strand:- start:20505 stop:21170 length:666 start_codon:yes stop_codon:yes gene_type:complete
MFKKVLVAEDLGSINEGIQATLRNLSIPEIAYASYCDEAYLKVKKATLQQAPFELLITDLSFKPDYRNNHLASGKELASILAAEHPEVPIIIFSVDDRVDVARALTKLTTVKGYVCKGRKGLLDLTAAIKEVSRGNSFYSEPIANGFSKDSNFEITDFDVTLLDQLSKGYQQEDISYFLKEQNIRPSSLSTVEKRLSKLKDHFNAKNSTQLVALAKDMGLI